LSGALDTATYTVTDEFGQTATANLNFDVACPPAVSIVETDDLGGTFSLATNNTTGGKAIPGSAVTYTVEVANTRAEAPRAQPPAGQPARGSGSGVRRASISARRSSSQGGSTTLRPSSDSGTSWAKPGPSSAISYSTPPGSRK